MMSMKVRLLEWMCRCYKRCLSYDTHLTDNFQALSIDRKQGPKIEHTFGRKGQPPVEIR